MFIEIEWQGIPSIFRASQVQSVDIMTDGYGSAPQLAITYINADKLYFYRKETPKSQEQYDRDLVLLKGLYADIVQKLKLYA